jgi:NDP-sugar pyrophosphorylase family protein
VYAIIRAASISSAPLLQIAGKALVIRQLQWLRAVGCDRIVVELSDDTAGDAVAGLIEDAEAVGDGVVLVSSAERLSHPGVARRGGVPDEASFLLVQGDVIGDADLTRVYLAAEASGAKARFAPHPELVELQPASVVLHGQRRGARPVVEGSGWVVRVRHAADALALTSAVLSGRLSRAASAIWPIQVHAAEIRPGVWLSRGARVDAAATLVPPVLIGVDASVLAGARVGPSAVVGAASVIGRGVTVEHAEIAPNTLVADGLAVQDCVAGPSRMMLLDGSDLPVDPILLDRVDGRSNSGLTSRLIALALLVLVAPAAVVLARAGGGALAWLTRDLLEVVLGQRALVGVRSPCPDALDISAGLRASAATCPTGVVDVSRALVPDDADTATKLRARAWYARAKSPVLDFRLVLRALSARRRLA